MSFRHFLAVKTLKGKLGLQATLKDTEHGNYAYQYDRLGEIKWDGSIL
jgi:hypothetical protein